MLCEGGPTLNGQLLSAGLVDEVCLTLSPVLVGGRGPRISGWDDPHPALGLELISTCETEGVLMLRYGPRRVEAGLPRLNQRRARAGLRSSGPRASVRAAVELAEGVAEHRDLG